MPILISFQEKKRRKYLITIILVAVLGIVALLIYRYWYLPKKELSSPVVVVPEKEVKINFEILESPLLKNLQPFQEIPAFEGNLGRENPFKPY